MSGNQTKHNWLDELFRDGGAGLFPPTETTVAEQSPRVGEAQKFNYPILQNEAVATEAELRSYWRTMRNFFRTGKGGGLPRKDKMPSSYPALLAPFLHARETGLYPVWMEDKAREKDVTDPMDYFCPLSSLLHKAFDSFSAEEPGFQTLKDNLPRLESLIQKQLVQQAQGFSIAVTLGKAFQELLQRLDLKEQDAASLEAFIEKFKVALPDSGILLPFSPDAPFFLLANLIQLHSQQQSLKIKQSIAPLLAGIRQLLQLEQTKDPASKTAASLEATMDFARSFLKFEELAAVLPSSGSAAMPEERLHRLEHVLQTLEQAEKTLFESPAFLVVGENLAQQSGFVFREHFPGAAVEIVPDKKVFSKIATRFDQKIKGYADVFAAIRIARLELDNQYYHEVHGDFFGHFNWTSFSEEELAGCPPFIALIQGAELLRSSLQDLSGLLASNRPIKNLVFKFDALGHLQQIKKDDTADPVFRQEPGALAIAHRDAFVMQTTVADSVGLFKGLREGLESPTPSFSYVLTPDQQRQLPGSGLLWASGALGSREFPSFVFDCRKGPKWGSRFDISRNPQLESDWPEETLLYSTETETEISKTIPFTFADFAAQDPDFDSCFHLVPAKFWTKDLIPIYEFLELSESEAYTRVPFIWMVDEENQLQKAAVALPLVQTCRERLDFWHFLQENTGIHSFHVETATTQLRQQMEADMAQEIAALKTEQQQAIEQAKEESARTALERVADYLLDLNVDALPASEAPPTQVPDQPAPSTSNSPKQEKETPAATSPAQEASPEPEQLSTNEVWIETPLCTTCNECTNINDRIFKYNTDKQAYIADPAAGPFADIVAAAENCPVEIIHPGSPLNTNEPGLEALIKRAEKFN